MEYNFRVEAVLENGNDNTLFETKEQAWRFSETLSLIGARRPPFENSALLTLT